MMSFSKPLFRKLFALATAPERTMMKLEQKAGYLEGICEGGLHRTILVSTDILEPLTREMPVAECLEGILGRLLATSPAQDMQWMGTEPGRPNHAPDVTDIPSKRLKGDEKRSLESSQSFPPSKSQGSFGFHKLSRAGAFSQGSPYSKSAKLGSELNVSKKASARVHVPMEAKGSPKGCKEPAVPKPFARTQDRTIAAQTIAQGKQPDSDGIIQTTGSKKKARSIQTAKAGKREISSTKALRLLKKRTASSPAHSGWDRPVRIEKRAESVSRISSSIDRDNEMRRVDEVRRLSVYEEIAGPQKRSGIAESAPPGPSRKLQWTSPSQEHGPHNAASQNTAARANRKKDSQIDDVRLSSKRFTNPSTPTGLRGLATKFDQNLATKFDQTVTAECRPETLPIAPPVPSALLDQREETLLEERLNRILLRAARRQGIDVEDLER